MPFQLREARSDDIPDMRRIYYSAFGDTIIGGNVFMTNIEASNRFLDASYKEELMDSHCQLLVVTNKDTPDSAEEIVAFGKWGLPGASIDDPPPVEAWPSNGELAVDFFGAMTNGHREYMGDSPHYYLECIGTHKDWRGKGAAGLMIRWGLERADADKLPSFLEATPKGRPIYEKFGFKTLGERVFEWPQGTSVDAFMKRDAKTDTVTNGEQRVD
ncbi:hypothetical protein N0V84_011992 [Fusarium piperis]|uniref:N-acetyltransferase domain-containing protein n=1 Tax=Fusarium piperis TaxID=1435070 RepID=A0A9W8TDF7_9HYPO|nr:hypothetical protein N0V84_011992 [Fusarium piperis]